jgi:hypothetical protein
VRALSMRARVACLGLLWLVRELVTRIANRTDLGPNARFLDKLMAAEDLAFGGIDLCANAGGRKLIYQLMLGTNVFSSCTVPVCHPVRSVPMAQLQRRATAAHLTRRCPITVGCMTPRCTPTREPFARHVEDTPAPEP